MDFLSFTIIYCYALIVAEVHPCRKTQGREYHIYINDRVHADPVIALLFTCRRVHHEAEPLLYFNTVVLPMAPLTEKFFTVALHNPERRSWVKDIYLTYVDEPRRRT